MNNSTLYTIHVKPNAELAAIVDEVLRSPASRVFLVVPEDVRLVRHILNFKLLRREAEAERKEIIIVSSHPRVQSLATKAGLKVHQLTNEFIASLEGGEDIESLTMQKKHVADIVASPRTQMQAPARTRGKRKTSVGATISKRMPSRDDLLRNLLKRPSHEKKEERPRVSSYRNTKKKRPLILVAGGAILIGGLALALFFALPSVRVTLTPQTFDAEESIHATISANVAAPNIAQRILPGQIIENSEEQSQSFSATGRENIEEHATGTIRVFNEFSSAPQTLVATTRFISQDGYLFRTQNTVVIPGAKIEGGKIVASSTLVDVIAAEPGEAHNISSATFSIPGFRGTEKFAAFFGKSEGSMTGGFQGVANVVTEEDIENARRLLADAVTGRAADKLRANIPPEYFLAPGALEEDDVVLRVDKEPLSRADTFEVRAEVRARAVIVRTQDVEAVIDYYFNNVFTAQEGTRMLEERAITYAFGERNYEDGLFAIDLLVRQRMGAMVDTEDLARLLAGTREGEARRLLSQYPGLEKAHIRFWPFWVNMVPENEEKITVRVEY